MGIGIGLLVAVMIGLLTFQLFRPVPSVGATILQPARKKLATSGPIRHPRPRKVPKPLPNRPEPRDGLHFLTRKSNAPAVPVAKPRAESLVILGYLFFYAFILFGPLSGIVKKTFAPGPGQETRI